MIDIGTMISQNVDMLHNRSRYQVDDCVQIIVTRHKTSLNTRDVI